MWRANAARLRGPIASCGSGHAGTRWARTALPLRHEEAAAEAPRRIEPRLGAREPRAPRHPRQVVEVVLARVLRVNRLALGEDVARAERRYVDRLVGEADEVHPHDALRGVVASAVREAADVEVRPQLAVDA